MVRPTSSNWQLPANICKLSQNRTDFHQAATEWRLTSASYSSEPETCLCTHHPIHNLFHLTNMTTKKTAIVGSCCIERMQEANALPSMPISKPQTFFTGLKRIQENSLTSPNTALIEYGQAMKVLSEKDAQFLYDMRRKRQVSSKQMNYLTSLNRKLIAYITGQPASASSSTGGSYRAPVAPLNHTVGVGGVHRTPSIGNSPWMQQMMQRAVALANVNVDPLALIRQDRTQSVALAVMQKALEKKIWNQDNLDFYQRIAKVAFAALSPLQQQYKADLNSKLLQNTGRL